MNLKLIAVLCVVAAAACGQDVLIRGGKVIPCKGAELAEADVLVRNGRIEAVGKGLTTDGSASVVDARGRVVMPGFVLAHTSEGMDRTNEMVPVTPYISVLDGVDPSRPFFEDCLRDGHLTIALMPGERTIIGGTGVILRPHGLVVEDLLQSDNAGMKLSLIPSAGNRAAHLAKLRAALDDAKQHMERKQAESGATASGNVRFDLEAFQLDRRKRELARMLRGEIPAWIACGTPADVDQALRLVEEYKLKARLVLGGGTWRAFPLLTGKNMPVILDSEFEFRETDPETGEEVIRNLPQLLKKAGVKFAVTTAPSSLGRRYLWYQAASLVRAGLSREEALAAVTCDAADAIGLGARKGSLEVGKDADILVLTDDPLSGRAWVEVGIIGGKVAYERSKDPRLTEIFGAGK
ncbi:MAG: hypothetical protein EXS14_03915 [Planctomycetes bacterium]|nr:hypothetical protein [Planctomycetota bacterium]